MFDSQPEGHGVAFFATGLGLGLIMYILMTLEFPTHNFDFSKSVSLRILPGARQLRQARRYKNQLHFWNNPPSYLKIRRSQAMSDSPRRCKRCTDGSIARCHCISPEVPTPFPRVSQFSLRWNGCTT